MESFLGGFFMRRGFLWLGFMLLSSTALAKDLSNRLGVGYSDQFGVSGGLPSVAVRYYPSTDLAVGAALGVDTEKDAAKFGFAAKIMRIVFQEDNLNFYLGASAGLISREKRDEVTNVVNNDSGFDLSGFGGAEFFLPGLDSLSFSFEAGVGVASISSEVRFRTIGDSPLRAGIIFYF
jgi:hypothetical protein